MNTDDLCSCLGRNDQWFQWRQRYCTTVVTTQFQLMDRNKYWENGTCPSPSASFFIFLLFHLCSRHHWLLFLFFLNFLFFFNFSRCFFFFFFLYRHFWVIFPYKSQTLICFSYSYCCYSCYCLVIYCKPKL